LHPPEDQKTRKMPQITIEEKENFNPHTGIFSTSNRMQSKKRIPLQDITNLYLAQEAKNEAEAIVATRQMITKSIVYLNQKKKNPISNNSIRTIR